MESSAKKLIKALSGHVFSNPPFWFMRQAGRYLPEYRELRKTAGGFLELCFDPEKAAEITAQPIRRFGMDGAILFSDILVIPYALGQKLEYREGEGPKLPPLSPGQDLGGFYQRVANVPEALSPIAATLRNLPPLLPVSCARIGFAGAPWTVACYMVEGGGSKEFTQTRSAAYSHESWFASLIGLLTEATIAYLDLQIRNGAEAVQVFDSWAGLLPEEEFRKWCINPVKKIVASLRMNHPSVPVIGFPKGMNGMLESYAEETEVSCLGIDASVPLKAAAALQKITCVQGNLDPISLASDGNRALESAKRIIDALSGGPLIFNLGHGIIPSTPVENVRRLSEYLHSLPG